MQADLDFFVKSSVLSWLDNIPIFLKMMLYPLIISIFTYLMTNLKSVYYFFSNNNINDFVDKFYDKIYQTSAVIDFEICMIRFHHHLRMESDLGYHAVKHYIFKHYSELDGLRLFKKVPKTRSNLYNEEIWKNNDKSETNKNINIKESFLKDLYLMENRIILPNQLTVKSNLDIIRNTEDTGRGIDSEKFYFKLELRCNKYNNSLLNLNYLIQQYQQIVDDYNEYTQNKLEDLQFCYFYDTHSNDIPYFNKLYIGKEYKSLDSLFFPEKDKFLKDIDFFINNKEYYFLKGKPYRNIILAHGEPGCGKTSLIQGLLNLLRTKYNQKRQLIHLNFNKLTKKDLQNILFSEYIYVNDHDDGKQHIPFQNRVYFIEEIDGYDSFKSRDSIDEEEPNYEKIHEEIKNNKLKLEDMKNVTGPDFFKKRSKLSVQDLLELLDGPISIKNSEIFVMTTNYIDKIDKAILRPGRINHLLELKKSTVLDIKNILDFYYDSNIPLSRLKKFNNYQFTPALISESCNCHADDIDKCLEYLEQSIKDVK